MLRRSSLQNPFTPPGSTVRLLYPAAAALLVVLTGVTAVGALRTDWRTAADVVLTSGGKFAARIPGAETIPAPAGLGMGQAAALPRLAQASADDVVSMLSTPAADGTWNKAVAPTIAGLVLDKRMRSDDGVGARRLMEALSTEAKAAVPMAKTETDLMGKIAGSARFLWSMTTSAGNSVLSHFAP